jgi:hypothetical protein
MKKNRHRVSQAVSKLIIDMGNIFAADGHRGRRKRSHHLQILAEMPSRKFRDGPPVSCSLVVLVLAPTTPSRAVGAIF